MTDRRETKKGFYYALTFKTISEDEAEAKKRFGETVKREWELEVDGEIVTLSFGDEISGWMARAGRAEKDLLDLKGWVKEHAEGPAPDWMELTRRLGIEP